MKVEQEPAEDAAKPLVESATGEATPPAKVKQEHDTNDETGGVYAKTYLPDHMS